MCGSITTICSIIKLTPATFATYVLSLRYMAVKRKGCIVTVKQTAMFLAYEGPVSMWHSLKSIFFPRKEILCMSLDNQFQEQHSGPNIFFPFIIVLSPSWKYLSSWFCIALNILSISHKNFCNLLQFLFFCHALHVNTVSEWDKSDILHQETKSLGLMISLGQGAQYPDRCFS